MLGEPHATVHRGLADLMAEGIVGRVNHGTAHLPSSQRYHLTAQGIKQAAGILGFDTPTFRLAETNADRTSMVTRIGPVIVAVEQWDETYTATLERVDRHCREVGALALYYDAGGSRAGIRTKLRQVWREQQLSQYPVFGVNFGAAVEGADREFVRGQTNAQYFARRGSQLGWTLRLRATRTKRLMEGKDINLGTCLVINPAIEVLDGFLAQLAQSEYDETTTGKVEIANGPKDAPNPDLFDAACLAVSHDSRPSGPARLWVTTSIPGSKIVSTLPGPSLESRKARRAGEPSELGVTTSISRSVAIVITVCLTASTIGSNHAA